MLFFDAFVFNSVKSDFKIIHCQLNKVFFQSKSVTFVTSILIPEAPMGRGKFSIEVQKIEGFQV